MSQTALHYASQAKNINTQLKEALEKQEPWVRDVEVKRRELRLQYLNLLLFHPYEKESEHAVIWLWMNTSHSFISEYKRRLSILDRALQSATSQTPNPGGHGPVERRKIMSRFRQFLAEEEKFWQELVLRFYRAAPLEEARPILIKLGILANLDHNLPDATTLNNADASTLSPGAGGSGSMRHNYQFFPNETISLTPIDTLSDQQRSLRLTTLGKALVCLGDMARYRELYNESGGRPKAGTEDVPKKLKGKKRGAGSRGLFDDIPRPRNYEKAKKCYTQAQLLVPSDGNPAHQRAIVASYEKRTYESVYHYYRALCVRRPYEMAAENLNTVLKKFSEDWTRREGKGENPLVLPPNAPPADRARRFKDAVVAHQMLAQGVITGDTTALSDFLSSDIRALVDDKILPANMILEALVIAIGSLYRRRMVRPPSESQQQHAEAKTRATFHVLAFYRSLLEAAAEQVRACSRADIKGPEGLAARVSAELQRMLPALRIASRWLYANEQLLTQTEDDARRRRSRNRRGAHTPSTTAIDLTRFWTAYVALAQALELAFPLPHGERRYDANNKEPVYSLKEDVEMRGFSPLKKFAAIEGVVRASTEHPNDENIMRVSDLLEDARSIAETGRLPVVYDGKTFELRKSDDKALAGAHRDSSFEPQSRELSPAMLPQSVMNGVYVEMDEPRSSSRMSLIDDDDLVNEPGGSITPPFEEDAQRLIADDEDDEIVWDPQAKESPLALALKVPSVPASKPPSSYGAVGTAHPAPSVGDASPYRSPPSVSLLLGRGAELSMAGMRSPLGPAAPLGARAGTAPKMPPVIGPGITDESTTAEDLVNRIVGPRAPSEPSAPPSGKLPGRSPPHGNRHHSGHMSSSSITGVSSLFGTSIWTPGLGSLMADSNGHAGHARTNSMGVHLSERPVSVMPIQQQQQHQHQQHMLSPNRLGNVNAQFAPTVDIGSGAGGRLSNGRSPWAPAAPAQASISPPFAPSATQFTRQPDYRGASVPPAPAAPFMPHSSSLTQSVYTTAAANAAPPLRTSDHAPLGYSSGTATALGGNGYGLNDGLALPNGNVFANANAGLRREYRSSSLTAGAGVGYTGIGGSSAAAAVVDGLGGARLQDDSRVYGGGIGRGAGGVFGGGAGVAGVGASGSNPLMMPPSASASMYADRAPPAFGLSGLANVWGRAA